MEEAKDKELVYKTFDQFDINQDGFLDLSEVTNFVKHSYNKKSKLNIKESEEFFTERAEKLIEKVNGSGSKTISRDDFYYFYKTQ